MTADDLYLLLRADHIQAQGIVDTVTDPMIVLDQSLTVLTGGRAFFETFKVGKAETVGRKIYDLGNGQWDIPDLRLLLEQVIPRASAVVDYQVTHDFPGLGRRTMLVTARVLAHPDHAGRSMLLSITDATGRMQRAAADRLLLGELKHRIKNLFAQTRALARLTGTEGRSAADYRDALLARLQALADAHDVVFDGDAGSGMAALAERVLAPYAAGGAIRAGEQADIRFDVDRLLSISLVLHELATNAAKYGALSSAAGHVEIGWTLDDTGKAMRLTWIERGGPPAPPPGHQGYGSRLIDSVISYSLGGTAARRFGPEGVEVEISIPLHPG